MNSMLDSRSDVRYSIDYLCSYFFSKSKQQAVSGITCWGVSPSITKSMWLAVFTAGSYWEKSEFAFIKNKATTISKDLSLHCLEVNLYWTHALWRDCIEIAFHKFYPGPQTLKKVKNKYLFCFSYGFRAK